MDPSVIISSSLKTVCENSRHPSLVKKSLQSVQAALYTWVKFDSENSLYCWLCRLLKLYLMYRRVHKFKSGETEFATICGMVCRAGKEEAKNISGHGQAGVSCAIEQSKRTG